MGINEGFTEHAVALLGADSGYTKGDEMAKVSVQGTPEAAYVKALKWDFDGYHYVCKNLPENVKDKLKEVFDKWGIGYHGDRYECKPNCTNLFVTAKQFARVEFTFDQPKEATK